MAVHAPVLAAGARDVMARSSRRGRARSPGRARRRTPAPFGHARRARPVLDDALERAEERALHGVRHHDVATRRPRARDRRSTRRRSYAERLSSSRRRDGRAVAAGGDSEPREEATVEACDATPRPQRAPLRPRDHAPASRGGPVASERRADCRASARRGLRLHERVPGARADASAFAFASPASGRVPPQHRLAPLRDLLRARGRLAGSGDRTSRARSSGSPGRSARRRRVERRRRDRLRAHRERVDQCRAKRMRARGEPTDTRRGRARTVRRVVPRRARGLLGRRPPRRWRGDGRGLRRPTFVNAAAPSPMRRSTSAWAKNTTTSRIQADVRETKRARMQRRLLGEHIVERSDRERAPRHRAKRAASRTARSTHTRATHEPRLSALAASTFHEATVAPLGRGRAVVGASASGLRLQIRQSSSQSGDVSMRLRVARPIASSAGPLADLVALQANQQARAVAWGKTSALTDKMNAPLHRRHQRRFHLRLRGWVGPTGLRTDLRCGSRALAGGARPVGPQVRTKHVGCNSREAKSPR